jgi:rhodanese-related sulfurtransferase
VQRAKAVILEALLVVICGALFGLAANAVSPLGLRLSRNYFPTNAFAATNSAPTNATAASADPLTATLQRLHEHGLQTVASNEVREMFSDNRYEQGLFVFVDARDDHHYQAGHIPGAWQFDHYRPEQYLPGILPICLSAQKVIVYCTGGTCEDSEFAAVMLRDAGIPRDNLYVFAGGMAEWEKTGLPIESGARRSAQFVKPKP